MRSLAPPQVFFFLRLVRNSGRVVAETFVRCPYDTKRFKSALAKAYLRFRRNVGPRPAVLLISANLILSRREDDGVVTLRLWYGGDYRYASAAVSSSFFPNLLFFSYDRSLPADPEKLDPEGFPVPPGRTLLMHRPRIINSIKDISFARNSYPVAAAERLTENVLRLWSNIKLKKPLNLIGIYRACV